MAKPEKKLLQTFERTTGGINGYAVGAKNRAGEEVILIAPSVDTIARSAQFAGVTDVDMDRIQSVVVLPRCSVLDEVKGD
jgi:hypothetical protein